MTQSGSRARLGRRVGAVAAGFGAVVVSSLATDALMHASGVFPPMGQPMDDSLWALAATYRFAFNVVGGWLTARLAPEHPWRHVAALAILGLVAGTAGAVATWNEGPAFGPKWYALALALSAIPSVALGGRLFDAGARRALLAS